MLVLALVLVLAAGLVAAGTLASAVHTRARAQNAADLAALAGADLGGLAVAQPGAPGAANRSCPDAVLDRVQLVARANEASVVDCAAGPDGSVTVEVAVEPVGVRAGLPGQVRARARAGPPAAARGHGFGSAP